MKVKIVSIGNSKGIRIPKAMLQQCNIQDQVNLEVEEGNIVIKPDSRKPREGWDDVFKLMHKRKEDVLLTDETIDKEMEDWEWK